MHYVPENGRAARTAVKFDIVPGVYHSMLLCYMIIPIYSTIFDPEIDKVLGAPSCPFLPLIRQM